MEEQLTKKYGLPTAIAMVIGIVIGSGIFFKAEKILTATGGDLKIGILAWLLGGCIAIASACAFAVMATRYEKVGGVVDYAEATVGGNYAYYLGWFMAAVYFPCLTSTLCWVSARYTCVLLGYDILSGPCLAITMFYMVLVYFMNATAPKLAGKFQVSLTVIKLVPILLMAVIGTAAGLRSGLIVENFTATAAADAAENPLFAALAATSFAYEGWVIATTINAEIKNAKRNLPLALVFGVGAIMLIYLFYYVGIAGAVPNSVMMENGEQGARIAFATIFGPVAGTGLFVFVVLSCLGTCNGLMMACTRGFYSYFGTLLNELGPFRFDSSELPVITLYAMYIPIYLLFMKKARDERPFRRFVLPTLALIGAAFMILAAVFSYKMDCVYYLLVYAVAMALGWLLDRKNRGQKQAA